MSTKILGIQFRESVSAIAHEQMCISREIGDSAEVLYINATNDTIEWDTPEKCLEGFDGVVLGGSGEFDFDGNRSDDDPAKLISYTLLEKLRPLLAYILEHDIPMLGICYGHQLFGAFMGAKVTCDPLQKKSRSHELSRAEGTDEHALFIDVPAVFQGHYGHKDSLDRIPEGGTLLVQGGEDCRVSAIQYKQNIFTTQFHPELTLGDMIERINKSPGYLPEGVSAEDVFSNDPHSNKILHNFGAFVANKK